MKPRKLSLIILASLLVLVLAACGPADTAVPGDSAAPAGESPAEAPEPTEAPLSLGFASEAPGACSNAFYPLRADTVWTYQILSAADELQGSFSLAYENLTGESFDALMSLKNPNTEEIFQATNTWYCSADGIVSSDFATLNFTDLANVKVETLDYEGISLLPEDQWVVGAVWDSSYKVNVVFTVEDLEITSQMDVQLTNTIAGIEGISVAAGAYPEAYRVETTGSMNMDLEGDLGASFSNLPIEYTTWFVRDVGMVRQITTGPEADGSYTELFSLE